MCFVYIWYDVLMILTWWWEIGRLGVGCLVLAITSLYVVYCIYCVIHNVFCIYLIWRIDDSDLEVGNREARCWMLGARHHSRCRQDNPRHRQGIHHPEDFNLDLIIISIFYLIIIINIIIQTILGIAKASIILRIKFLSSSSSIIMFAMIVSKLWHIDDLYLI